jgi:hypothetical protein
MSRGWPTVNYIPFMIVHILIAASGIWLLKQETVKSAA